MGIKIGDDRQKAEQEGLKKEGRKEGKRECKNDSKVKSRRKKLWNKGRRKNEGKERRCEGCK